MERWREAERMLKGEREVEVFEGLGGWRSLREDGGSWGRKEGVEAM